MKDTSRTHALLITGRPGVGKTTVIRQVATSLPGWRLAGFYTEEIRMAEERCEFLTGRPHHRAHFSS